MGAQTTISREMASGALRSHPTPAGAALGIGVAAIIGGLAAAHGGFVPEAWGATSLALLWMLAIGALLRGWVRLGRFDGLMLASLAAFVAWTGLSAVWSLDPAQSMLEAERGVLYLAALAAVLLFARSGSAAPILVGVAAACVGVSIFALITSTSEPAELSQPLGYSNALGLMAAMGLILAVGFAADAATRAGRAAATAALIPLVATVWLSASAGAVAALVVGLAVAGVLGRRPRMLVVAATCAALLAVGLAGSFAGASVEPRTRYWTVAWQSAEQAPVAGHGAGSFARTWLQQRRAGRVSRNAHSLYLETLTELGVVGLVLLAVALATPIAAIARAPADPLAAASAGAYAAFLAHAGLDWDWEMPALVVAALCCGAAPLTAARRGQLDRRPPVRVCAVGLACVLALGAFAYVGLMSNLAIARSGDAAALGAVEDARLHAREATRWTPWSPAPWVIVGEAALARGDAQLARASFRQGLRRDPQSWRLWVGLAGASRGAARRAAVVRARALNPQSSLETLSRR